MSYGSLNGRGSRVVIGLAPGEYDRVVATYPDPTTEIYTYYYKTVVVAIITLTKNGLGDFLTAERTDVISP